MAVVEASDSVKSRSSSSFNISRPEHSYFRKNSNSRSHDGKDFVDKVIRRTFTYIILTAAH